jgi:hypothetical protein
MLAAGMHAGLTVSSDTPATFLRRVLPALAVCLLTAPAFAQHGAMTVPRNLEQLTHRADDIVRGNVVSARVEKHPDFHHLDTVVVTLRLRDTFKGPAHGEYTFRQYIWDVRDRHSDAGYRKGQDLLLFMIAPNEHGLSSPAGMEQGRFRITRDKTGLEVATNGAGNARLFAGLDGAARPEIALSAEQARLVAAHREGPVAVQELAAMIRAFAATQ